MNAAPRLEQDLQSKVFNFFISSGAKYFVDIHGVTILICQRHCVVYFHQSLLSFACSGKNDVFSPKNLRVRQLLPIAGR